MRKFALYIYWLQDTGQLKNFDAYALCYKILRMPHALKTRFTDKTDNF